MSNILKTEFMLYRKITIENKGRQIIAVLSKNKTKQLFWRTTRCFSAWDAEILPVLLWSRLEGGIRWSRRMMEERSLPVGREMTQDMKIQKVQY